MIRHGFLRVAAAAPALRVADCSYNAERIVAMLARAELENIAVLVFPELSLTGYTCGDLFHQSVLQLGALAALTQVVNSSAKGFSGIAVLGLPLAIDDQLFNCAAVVHRGRILGVVPKSFIPNYKEFYERRWFAAAASAHSRDVAIAGERVPFGMDLLFADERNDALILGVEICEICGCRFRPAPFQALGGYCAGKSIG